MALCLVHVTAGPGLARCPGAEVEAQQPLCPGSLKDKVPGVRPPGSSLRLRTHRPLLLLPVGGGGSPPASDTNSVWLPRRTCVTLVPLESENLSDRCPIPSK